MRPVANVGPIDQFETTGKSQYNSVQLQIRGRYTSSHQSIQYQIGYILGSVKDDVSDVFDLAGASALPQNSANFTGEYAPANFDVKHRLAYGFVYDLPTLQYQNKFIKQILDNWQFIGVGKYNTGQPFTVNLLVDINQDGNLTDRLDNTNFIRSNNSRIHPIILTANNSV